MSFNVWDIGGQASMSTVNQCFFTDKALYVVTWNLALGEEAVANLQTWLLNIEVNIPKLLHIPRGAAPSWCTSVRAGGGVSGGECENPVGGVTYLFQGKLFGLSRCDCPPQPHCGLFHCTAELR